MHASINLLTSNFWTDVFKFYSLFHVTFSYSRFVQFIVLILVEHVQIVIIYHCGCSARKMCETEGNWLHASTKMTLVVS